MFKDKTKKTPYAVNKLKQVGNAGKSPTKSVVSVRSASKTSLSGTVDNYLIFTVTVPKYTADN